MMIRDMMSRNAVIASPDQSIGEVAKIMAERDIGCLPVAQDDRLVGMITDRDIAIRAIAAGKGAETRVGDVMTEDVRYCFDDEELDEIAANMGDQQVRRMPVVDRDKKLVGMLSLCDLALRSGEPHTVGQMVAGISRKAGYHSQSLSAH